MNTNKQTQSVEQPEQRQLTRRELEVYREKLNQSLMAYRNNEVRFHKLENRPSFKKLSVEKMSRHFRRAKQNKEQLDKGTELLEKIDMELSK